MPPAYNNINSVVRNSGVRCLEVGEEKEPKENKERIL